MNKDDFLKKFGALTKDEKLKLLNDNCRIAAPRFVNVNPYGFFNYDVKLGDITLVRVGIMEGRTIIDSPSPTKTSIIELSKDSIMENALNNAYEKSKIRKNHKYIIKTTKVPNPFKQAFPIPPDVFREINFQAERFFNEILAGAIKNNLMTYTDIKRTERSIFRSVDCEKEELYYNNVMIAHLSYTPSTADDVLILTLRQLKYEYWKK